MISRTLIPNRYLAPSLLSFLTTLWVVSRVKVSVEHELLCSQNYQLPASSLYRCGRFAPTPDTCGRFAFTPEIWGGALPQRVHRFAPDVCVSSLRRDPSLPLPPKILVRQQYSHNRPAGNEQEPQMDQFDEFYWAPIRSFVWWGVPLPTPPVID